MKLIRTVLSGLLAASLGAAISLAADNQRWVTTWVSTQQITEPHNLPAAPGLAGHTLRQIVQVSLGGTRLRVTFSNVFGDQPLTMAGARVALSAGGAAIEPASDRALTFNGQPGITIQPGASMISDEISFETPALRNLAISAFVTSMPPQLTGHPGSRTTSYIQKGDALAARDLPESIHVDHWYLLSGVEVVTEKPAAAIVVLGDSITDGRGSITNQNNRWPNLLARRLQAAGGAMANISVLNQGAGGNRILRDGLGPNALARFDRDVLAPTGVRWLVILEGVNDVGTAVGARAKGEPAASAQDLIQAFRQMIWRAHSHNIRVYGATIMPFGGNTGYDSPESEADRQTVNQWIRTSGEFDAVIDFDAITRDPKAPSRLSAAVDGGDHLHPSAAGYEIMAGAIDLKLFSE